jgi:hypothetical protein
VKFSGERVAMVESDEIEVTNYSKDEGELRIGAWQGRAVLGEGVVVVGMMNRGAKQHETRGFADGWS